MASNAPHATLWSFWPSWMWVPGPGCYGVQLDTLSGTDVVVFQATSSLRAVAQQPVAPDGDRYNSNDTTHGPPLNHDVTSR